MQSVNKSHGLYEIVLNYVVVDLIFSAGMCLFSKLSYLFIVFIVLQMSVAQEIICLWLP